MLKIKLICTITLICITCLHSNALGQVFGGGGSQPSTPSTQSAPTGGAPSAYYFGQGQGVLIDINLWGQVGSPGKYYVPYTTDLVSLISIAGGPQLTAKLDDIRVIRYTRQDTSVVEKVVRVDIEKFIETGEQNFPPLLRGDTVIVPGGALSVFNTIVTVTTGIFGILNAVLFILILNRQLS